MSRCLQLDVGNSNAKWRLVESGAVISRGSYSVGDAAGEAEVLGCTETVDNIWISSVAGVDAEQALDSLLQARWGTVPWFARTTARAGQLVNSYQDPSRMGVDRWLAMLGARNRTCNRVCVVDAGSALTIDLIAASGEHEGGYIIPGPSLMERALLRDTDRVRFGEDIDYALTPGRSTAAAVRHGIALAQAGAVAMALDAAGPEQPELMYCGGAGRALMDLLGRGGEWAPDLVFEGLEVLARTRVS